MRLRIIFHPTSSSLFGAYSAEQKLGATNCCNGARRYGRRTLGQLVNGVDLLYREASRPLSDVRYAVCRKTPRHVGAYLVADHAR